MTNIKLEINGLENVEKEVDIRNFPNVTIYQNNNSDEKYKSNHVQEETLEANLKFPSFIFDITALHHSYWKEFCDAYYSSLGLLPNENSTYEQKYETFCQLLGKRTERKGEIEKGLAVKEEDFKFLKILEKRLYTLKEREELISTLYYYVRTIGSVRRKIINDIWVIKNINPCYIKTDYSEYILDETQRFAEGDEYWPIIRDVLKYHMNVKMLEEMLGEEAFFNYTEDSTRTEIIDETGDTFDHNPAEGSVIFLVNEILEGKVKEFNHDLHELTDLLSENNKYSDGKEQKYFLYRLFMSYESSLPEIKNMLEELPSPLNLIRLQKKHNRLIRAFSKSPLGNQWIRCMEYEDGIKYIAKYFMNKQNNLTTEEKSQFFYILDKICIIEDVLKGNAKKYDLDIAYPDDWFTQNTSENTDVAPQEKSIPQSCTDAIKNVMCPTFTSAQKEVLNSREQIAKAAKTINLNRNVNVAMLMAVALEVNAIRPDTNTRDFIRTLIGMGVIKYSGDKAIGKMADVVNKKLHGYKRKGKKIPPLPANHRFWKETERAIGDKIFRAMTIK